MRDTEKTIACHRDESERRPAYRTGRRGDLWRFLDGVYLEILPHALAFARKRKGQDDKRRARNDIFFSMVYCLWTIDLFYAAC